MWEDSLYEKNCGVHHDKPDEEYPVTKLVIVENHDSAKVTRHITGAKSLVQIIRYFVIAVAGSQQIQSHDKDEVPRHVRSAFTLRRVVFECLFKQVRGNYTDQGQHQHVIEIHPA